ncbi:hypothetical protein CIPAW_05G163800 [Carya illinoinensis]|uniref:Uncharacterized protein n=1 Tax=Carya illinoinensis TaxID=32201 RepID=A0A8T1QKP5_CARIL|nr:hypothetical protein CIPAW_05G163800 [Carya illinoinensis]KAG6654693.1 hypothetical protein CIPAW_05G163800 [Carya illinoinensis]KAG6654694.1 hypothetical protein CIPAW_05G163800 [Carya illinoinensis]
MGIPKLSTWNMKFKATDSQTLLYFNLENELSAIAIERRLTDVYWYMQEAENHGSELLMLR